MLDDRVCTARGAHNYHDTIKAIRKYDERLANYVEAKIPHTQWHDMVHEARAEKRGLYERLKAVVEAMQQDAPAVMVEGIPTHPGLEAWEVARQIAATYRCDRGFIDKPQVHTVIVTLRGDEPITGLPPIILKASDGLARDMESVRKWTFGWDNRIFIMDLGPDAIRELKKHPAVASVEYSEEPEARILGTPNPPYNPMIEQTDWGVQRIKTAVPWGRTPPLYGNNVKVCVIDTGIDYNHQAYWKNGVCVYKGGFNFVGSNEDPRDDQDHGTWCAGIVAEQHNGNGYRGVAPDVDLYACKALDSKGSGSYANIAAAIDWSRTNGMHIISLSLGGSASQAVLKTACDTAWYAGCLIVASAGNSGPEDNTVGYPAAYQSVVAVAAMDFNEQVATFSSRGPEVEIAAPGVHITGPWAGFTYDEYATPDGLYMCANGTSPACPHVSGAAALVKSWYPLMSNIDLRMWLRDHARDI